MAETGDRARVEGRIDAINHRLSEINDFVEFAASTDAQYRMADAERGALKAERNQLKEILGDL